MYLVLVRVGCVDRHSYAPVVPNVTAVEPIRLSCWNRTPAGLYLLALSLSQRLGRGHGEVPVRFPLLLIVIR